MYIFIVPNYLLLPFSISIIIIRTSLMPNLWPCYCLNRTLLLSCLVNALLSSFIVDLRQLKPTIEAIKNYELEVRLESNVFYSKAPCNPSHLGAKAPCLFFLRRPLNRKFSTYHHLVAAYAALFNNCGNSFC